VRRIRPGRSKFGSKGNDQQYRQAADPGDRKVQPLARGRVDPVQVFEEEWCVSGKAEMVDGVFQVRDDAPAAREATAQ
jgi:hypothetical protein